MRRGRLCAAVLAIVVTLVTVFATWMFGLTGRKPLNRTRARAWANELRSRILSDDSEALAQAIRLAEDNSAPEWKQWACQRILCETTIQEMRSRILAPDKRALADAIRWADAMEAPAWKREASRAVLSETVEFASALGLPQDDGLARRWPRVSAWFTANYDLLVFDEEQGQFIVPEQSGETMKAPERRKAENSGDGEGQDEAG